MTKNPLVTSGPYTHQNLAIFLFHGPDQIDGNRYTSLKDAFDQKQVRIYETGRVGELKVKNLSRTTDIFIQSGDVLKGGRQDRTVCIDFIIPARSGRVRIPTLCVESGRWRKRRGEDDAHFSSSSHSLHAKSIRIAAAAAQDQHAVWHSVAESQEVLGAALGKSVHALASPSSYQLSMEDPDLERRKRQYQDKLYQAAASASDVVGYAFYVKGERNTIDIYPSTNVFQKLWSKLLGVAILEAISAQNGKATVPDKADVEAWLEAAAKAPLRETKNAPPRTRVQSKSYENGIVFETFDDAIGDHVALHTNIISDSGS